MGAHIYDKRGSFLRMIKYILDNIIRASRCLISFISLFNRTYILIDIVGLCLRQVGHVLDSPWLGNNTVNISSLTEVQDNSGLTVQGNESYDVLTSGCCFDVSS